MYYVTIDCGTTNSRAYVVDGNGHQYGKATKNIGVRDTATTGSRDVLRAGLREIVVKAIAEAKMESSDIGAILSSGMITSEIGLHELPHLSAPCGISELAAGIAKIDDAGIYDDSVPVYFVRGIKNAISNEQATPTELVGKLDFMRGEETQVIGLLASPTFSLPATIVVLSSHTKFIPVDSAGMICGSLTTLSGQLYNAIIEHTFVGKSIQQCECAEKIPDGYFDESIINNAIEWIDEVGLVRALMFPRFLDVLLDTKWYERSMFLDALVAAEDMLAIKQLSALMETAVERFTLVGQKERCRLYSFILQRRFQKADISSISDTDEVDQLSISGILTIMRKAGIVA